MRHSFFCRRREAAAVEALVAIVILVSLSVLHHQHIAAHRHHPHHHRHRGHDDYAHNSRHHNREEMLNKGKQDREKMEWWAEDYSEVRRRWPIHNRLQP
ncbi:unnamed protein product [Spirodela intermedia]|uniref:Uncharacterized protein n=2 Tax=Spirodela intermedia TaxID=51605 RepID=A0A7I8IP21_SPIIN|nr:unnamed protein product [Spirodela intermedia]CAA6659608.1 unnamed protein product [Spirodela intermedia]CAA7395925.1 unnamed protein product [Spirodela intermedia]